MNIFFGPGLIPTNQGMTVCGIYKAIPAPDEPTGYRFQLLGYAVIGADGTVLKQTGPDGFDSCCSYIEDEVSKLTYTRRP